MRSVGCYWQDELCAMFGTAVLKLALSQQSGCRPWVLIDQRLTVCDSALRVIPSKLMVPAVLSSRLSPYECNSAHMPHALHTRHHAHLPAAEQEIIVHCSTIDVPHTRHWSVVQVTRVRA
jgi:hypothetical protein